MAEVIKPIMLDETGQAIVGAINKLATAQGDPYEFIGGENGFTVNSEIVGSKFVTVTPVIENASAQSAGLMSSSDFTKLQSIDESAIALYLGDEQTA